MCVNKIRKEDGEPYTPRSITQLLSGLQRHILTTKKAAVRLVDSTNPIFNFVSSVGHSSGVNLDQDPKTAAIGVPSDGIELIPRSNPTASRFVSSVGHSSSVDQDPKTAETGVAHRDG